MNTPVSETTPIDPLKQPLVNSEDRLSNLFSTTEALDRTKWTRAFKIHVNIAVATSVISATVWFMVAMFGASFPWFIYPALTFAWTLSLHFYLIVRHREWLQFHTCSFVIVNLICFLTWLATGWNDAWFLNVFFGLALLLVPHWVSDSYKGEIRRNFYIHLSFVAVLDTLIFFIWMSSGKGFPWFFYPIFSFAIPLIIHWTCTNYSAKDELTKKCRLWKMHSLLFADIQLMLFVTWVATGGFPWFVFALGGWGAVLIVHYYRYRRLMTKSELPTSYVPTQINENTFQTPYAGVVNSPPSFLPVQGQPQPGQQLFYYVPPQQFSPPQTVQPILYPQVPQPVNSNDNAQM